MDNNDVTSPASPVLLVVDDDPMMRKLVAQALVPLRAAAVIEVEDGLQAQRVLNERTVDVVITDVLMPNMDGRELMRWAQENCTGPLWIVLSGLESFDAAVEALQLGAFDYLSKPPEPNRVRLAVRNALDQLSLTKERACLFKQLESSNDQLAEKVSQLEGLCRMLEDQAEVIDADLTRAEVIQCALLPRNPPKLEGWCIESLYRPGSHVGGDFYDIVKMDDRHLGLVIADAAGHGVAAAMLSVLFKHRLQLWDTTMQFPLMPAQVLSMLNQRLYNDVSVAGGFITAVYGLLDQRSGHLHLASAGHTPCIWTNVDGQTKLIERTGPALGLTKNAQYRDVKIELARGDRLLVYTDGVLDGGSRSPSHQDLGEVLADRDRERRDLLKGIHEAAVFEAGSNNDDITMILLERSNGSSCFDDTSEAVKKPLAPVTNDVQIMSGAENEQGFMSIAGTGTWTRSGLFLDSALKLLKRSDSLTIDLGACEYLDSTFLGTLHELVTKAVGKVHLQRVGPPLRALFEELSMESVLLHINITIAALPAKMLRISRDDHDENAQARRILKAHEVLASLSDENEQQFHDVVESLRQDLESNAASR